MLFMSQAPTLQFLNMRHDALPADFLGALGSLQALTFVGVRCRASQAKCSFDVHPEAMSHRLSITPLRASTLSLSSMAVNGITKVSQRRWASQNAKHVWSDPALRDRGQVRAGRTFSRQRLTSAVRETGLQTAL